MTKTTKLAGCAVLLTFLLGCGGAPEPADLLLLGGRIITVDPVRPEATALAARDGRIVAVGDDAEIERYRGEATRVIELQGRLALPGFIEGHAHFYGLGRSLMNVDLKGAAGWDEVVARVAAAARDRSPGEWIVGRGWHQEKWDAPPQPNVEGYPTHESLSRAVPDHPVMLSHASGHASMVNARAMELAGVDRSTPDPPGGEILRDRRGNPTGLLRETAELLVGDLYGAAEDSGTPEQVAARTLEALRLADRECLSKGVTSFQDAGVSFARVDQMRAAVAEGELGVRLWIMLYGEQPDLAERMADYRVVGEYDERLTVRGIKLLIDGALGAHGAWLLEPYTDLPGHHGHNTIPLDELERTARLAIEHEFQLCVHAIGDRGNREVLDIYERVFAEQPEPTDLRWRVEHAQHLDPADIPRFAELDVIASMQGIHCASDGPWVPTRLGEERAARGAYVWRALIDSGAVVSNGTDAPVEDVDPIAGYHALVTRRTTSGEPFHSEQRMTRMEALEAYTIHSAFAAFEDGIKGSLTPGKLADVVVLSADILTVPEEEILDAEALYTIVGGEVRYTHPAI